jgi:hypothetical protein
MNKYFFILAFSFITVFLFPVDSTTDITGYLPENVKSRVFEKEILSNITNSDDKEFILRYYKQDAVKYKYYLKFGVKKVELIKLYNIIFSYKKTHGILELERTRVIHENEYPVFSQKGGMLRPGDHSFYFKTDDEWTGFSTIFLGYRFGVAEYFNIAVEGGAGLPQVYIGSIILHLKLYESPGKSLFVGLRGRLGYKYQNAESFMFTNNSTGESLGYLGLGKNYLTIINRHSFYFAADLTIAARFGRLKAQAVYYSIYPKVDFDLLGGQTYVMFCPGMIGYEVRFGNKMEWSFAVEGGYSFPVPWGSIPDGKWINFPSLANVSVNYRFGDNYYSGKNQDKIYNEVMKE